MNDCVSLLEEVSIHLKLKIKFIYLVSDWIHKEIENLNIQSKISLKKDRVKFSGDSGYSGDSKINIKFFVIGYSNIMFST